jgi:hypothetical protein
VYDANATTAFLTRLALAIAEGRVRVTWKADVEIAELGWSRQDAFDELSALAAADLLRTEPGKHPDFRRIWVFCPLAAELEEFLWIRLAERDDHTFLVSFHLAEGDPWH